MTEYFGAKHFNSTVGDINWSGYTYRSLIPYTCPGGSGSKTVYSLEVLANSTLGTGHVKLALYDSSLNKVCEGAAEVTVGTDRAWYGHVGQANISPNPCTISAGSDYYILISIDSNDVGFVVRPTDGVNAKYYVGDYTGSAFPASFSGGTDWAKEWQLRVGLTGDPPAAPSCSYFGATGTSANETSGWQDKKVRNAAAYACPGTGDRKLLELSCYCRDADLTYTSSIRIGIYDSSYNLVAQGKQDIWPGTTAGWYGHIGQDELDPYETLLTGGDTYYLGISNSVTMFFTKPEASLTNGLYYADDSSPYAWVNGMWATLAGDPNYNERWCIRAGVERIPSSGFWIPIMRMIDQQRSGA